MGNMKRAVKLRCGHCFHRLCVLQMVSSQRASCPICRKPVAQANSTTASGGSAQVFDHLVENMLQPLIARTSPGVVTPNDIARVAQVFSSLSRSEIEAEILHAGSVEQAILNLSERL